MFNHNVRNVKLTPTLLRVKQFCLISQFFANPENERKKQQQHTITTNEENYFR